LQESPRAVTKPFAMPEIQASRRLVKSPPELWAEVSDAASLARHLGEVGEITITRLEPETTVAWEGERASGTVELAPAGWGTSVTLTAAPAGAAEAESEPVAVELEPELVAEEAPAPAPVRRSWIARLFSRRVAAQPAPEPVEPASVAVEEPEPAPDPLADTLALALDSLGSAHHRPFSRG
jgi:hypothetical protein